MQTPNINPPFPVRGWRPPLGTRPTDIVRAHNRDHTQTLGPRIDYNQGMASLACRAPSGLVGALLLVVAGCTPGVDGVGGRRDGGAIDFIDMARNTTSCVGGGTVCSSSNPGKCDTGTVTCDGKRAMCTPDSMVQDCYTGPAGTAGVGVCASGAQSCIGILGECQGQILPAAKEDCANDLDDDCDGKVNNGCPTSIATGTPRPLAPLVGAGGNANAKDLNVKCPTDSFVTGLTLEFYDAMFQVSGVRLNCGKAILTRTPDGKYSLSTQPVMPQPYVSLMADPPATGTGIPIVANCTGIGLRAMFTMRGSYDVKSFAGSQVGGITGLFATCGLGTATLNADNTLNISVMKTGTESGYDYGPAVGATPVSWVGCNANEVIIGFNGRVSTCGQIAGDPPVPASCLDKVQPVCAPLVANYIH